MHIDLAEMTRIRGRLDDLDTELQNTLNQVNGELDSICSNLRSSELLQSNQNLKTKISNLSADLMSQIKALGIFMDNQLKDYTISNETARESLTNLVNTLTNTFSADGTIIAGASVVAGAGAIASNVSTGGTTQGTTTPSTGTTPISDVAAPTTDTQVSAPEVLDTTEPVQTPVATYNAPLSDDVMTALVTTCNERGIDPKIMLGLIETESNFDTNAVSSAGCYGLCQLSNRYFQSAGMTPVQNVTTATNLLADLVAKYNGDMSAALTAYNAGHDTGSRTYANKVLNNAKNY